MKHKLAIAVALCTTAALAVGGSHVAAQQVKLAKIKTATSISAKEKQDGAQAHPQLMAEFGEAYKGPQAAYVTRIGQRIAVQSGMSNATSDFTITLLNSPVNNAFAIPGGYVYVTRQLLALMNDEAELAGVLGHEVGHVAARHSKRRQNAATRNAVLGVLGAVLGGAIGDNGGLLGSIGGLLQNNSMQLAQLATLGFSRGQELEADQLGAQYLVSAGYDPAALASMLSSLANQTALDARVAGRDARSLPAWASTHPDPASRVQRASAIARQIAPARPGVRNADAFLAAIDGVMYADDPAQGVIEANEFLHPDLKLRFSVPAGFGMQNGATAVSIAGTGGQAQFSFDRYAGDFNAYIDAVYTKLGGKQKIPYGQIRLTTVNGLPAAYASATVAQQGQQSVDVTVFAYEFAVDRAYHFVAVTPAGQMRTFDPMFASVRRMSDADARAVRPRQLRVVTVGRNDTMASLAGRMAFSTYQADRFQVLNGFTNSTALRPGQKVKIVTYSNR